MSWRVEVFCDGDSLVAIEDRMLTGKPEFTEAEAQLIRNCAEHLSSFIGPKKRGKFTGDNLRGRDGFAYIDCVEYPVTIVTHIRADRWLVQGDTLPDRFQRGWPSVRRAVVHRSDLCVPPVEVAP